MTDDPAQEIHAENLELRESPGLHRAAWPSPVDSEAYALYQDVLKLRNLLELVAQDLERLASDEPNASRRDVLLGRSMRISAAAVGGVGRCCAAHSNLAGATRRRRGR